MTNSTQLVVVAALVGLLVVVITLVVARRQRRRRVQQEAEASFAAAIRVFRARPAAALNGLADASEQLDRRRLESLIDETQLYGVVSSHLQALSSDEAGRSALEDFFRRLGPSFVEHDAEAAVGVIQRLFASQPDGEEAQRCGLAMLTGLPPIALRLSEGVYQAALELLEHHPRSKPLEGLALEVGRWHLDRVHDAGGSSYYDEHAIRTDILARIA